MVATTFKPLGVGEREKLFDSLQRNVEHSDALVMNPTDTTFIGSESEVGESELKLINRIKSVPCHY